MPSGKTHDRITFLTLPLVVGLSYLIKPQWHISLIIAFAYLFSGLMFGPDLDIYSLQYQRWGMLRGIWIPYQKGIRHRSFLSHGLIIGTLLRLLYLFFCLCILIIFILIVLNFTQKVTLHVLPSYLQSCWQLIRQYPQEAIALLLGLELGAMSHSISDQVSTQLKSFVSPKTRIKSAKKREKFSKNKKRCKKL